jgi:large subunit ribosomal protein L4
LSMKAPRSRDLLIILDALQLDSSVLILMPQQDVAVEKSAKNLPDVKTLRANYLNIHDILGHDYLLVPKGALELVESFLG